MALNTPTSKSLGKAVLASIVGGVVFGILMTMMDMIPMVAMLVGSESVAVGWLVHLGISAVFGIPLAFLLANLKFHPAATGMVWGVVAWVVGALVLMPLLLGMPGMVFALNMATPWWSLLGHLMYGLVAGLVYTALAGSTMAHASTAAGE